MKKRSLRPQSSRDSRPSPPRRTPGRPAAPGASRKAAPAPAAVRPRRKADDSTLFSAAALPAALVSPSGRLLQTSAGLRELLGYSASELRRLRFTDLTHPDDRERWQELLRRVRNGDSGREQLRLLHSSGPTISCQLYLALASCHPESPC